MAFSTCVTGNAIGGREDELEEASGELDEGAEVGNCGCGERREREGDCVVG